MTSVDHLDLRTAGRDVVAAGPESALALMCLASFFIPEVAARFVPRLRLVIGMEFIAIHSFVLLGGLALLKPKRWWSHILRAGAFIAICAFYSYFASQFGPDGFVSFWVLTVSTYFGFFVHDAPAQRRDLLICRWVIVCGTYLALLAVVIISADLLDVRSPRRELLFGFSFFTALAVFDLVRFYDRSAAPLMKFIRSAL